jgi:hypothetical protein
MLPGKMIVVFHHWLWCYKFLFCIVFMVLVIWTFSRLF